MVKMCLFCLNLKQTLTLNRSPVTWQRSFLKQEEKSVYDGEYFQQRLIHIWYSCEVVCGSGLNKLQCVCS